MIHVIDGYRVREGVIIERGFYEDDAPELHELGEYLLKNGHARKAEPGDIQIQQDKAVAQSFEDYDGDLLKVHQGYRVAEGHIIHPGLYRIDDPALAGRADYLVENLYAAKIVRVAPVEPETEPAAKSLSKMTVAELQDVGASLGLTFPEDMLKADMVKAIKEAGPKE